MAIPQDQNAARDCAAIVAAALSRPEYAEIISMATEATDGNIYLVGGFLYRTLNRELNGMPMAGCDMDICVDGKIDHGRAAGLFHGAEERKTRHQGGRVTKVKHKGVSADLFELREYVDTNCAGMPVTIRTYLSSVPFDVQAIAYEPSRSVLFDGGGVAALLKREMKVNNQGKVAADPGYWMEKGLSKARELGLTFRSGSIPMH